MSRKRGRMDSGRPREISIKAAEEIAHMRRAGQIVALVLARLAEAAEPGVTTEELDRLAEGLIRSFGATPTFHRLYGFPAHICVSVNDEVVHGIPRARRLQEGDIVSFDVGATVGGLIADGAATVGVGEVSPQAAELIRIARESLCRALRAVRPGNRVWDISAAVQEYVEGHGCAVVRKLVGHGVGREMHEAPQVPNFVSGERESSPELLEGMTLAIEPMVTQGSPQVVQDADGWTYRTRDGSLAAHFEHTVAVTRQGCEVLTRRQGPAGEAVCAGEARGSVSS